MNPQGMEQRRPRKFLTRWWIVLLIACVLAGGLALFFVKGNAKKVTAATTQRAVSSASTPVVAVPVKKRDFTVYLPGLGSVVPLNTTVVKSRVDGELVRILFKEGQIVNAGDLLAEIDPRPFQVQLTQAEGAMARDQALLDNAKIDAERYKDLVKKDLIPKQQLDTQISLVDQYHGAVKADQGQIDNAKLMLTYSRITAPISGRVGLRQVDLGNIVHATDQNGIVVITQLQPIAVVFSLAEDNIRQIMRKINSGARLVVEAYDRDQKQKLAVGTLQSVDNQIDPTTGTVKLKAVFPNRNNELFPNQFVNARLLVEVKPGALIVPAAAIQRGPQGTYVYAVKPDGTVELRKIDVGIIQEGDASITAGLSANDLVVVDGADRLRDGVKVELKSQNTGTRERRGT